MCKTFDAVIKSYLFLALDNFLFRNALYVLIPNLFVILDKLEAGSIP